MVGGASAAGTGMGAREWNRTRPGSNAMAAKRRISTPNIQAGQEARVEEEMQSPAGGFIPDAAPGLLPLPATEERREGLPNQLSRIEPLNLKSEFRSPKSERNPKLECRRLRPVRNMRHRISEFGLLSGFGIRNSGFWFRGRAGERGNLRLQWPSAPRLPRVAEPRSDQFARPAQTSTNNSTCLPGTATDVDRHPYYLRSRPHGCIGVTIW